MVVYDLRDREDFPDAPLAWKRDPELFFEINNYHGLYAISNHGRIYSIKQDILLKPYINHGYCQIALSKSGKKKTFKIARLVAIHFIPNPENKPEVNHLKSKIDNYYKSIEWSTPKENIRHAFDTGRCTSDHCNQRVKATEIATGKILEFYSTREAERELKIGGGYVSAVLVGKYQSAKGYIFERI